MSVESECSGSPVASPVASPTAEDVPDEALHADGVAEEEIEEYFLCTMCQDKYKDPRILSCLHVYCLECLQKLTCSEANEIRCPDCQQQTRLGQSGVGDLQEDHVMMNALDMAAILNMQTTCTSCKAKEKAVARCSDCANFLCPNCVTAHQFMRCFENHKVVSFDEMNRTDGPAIHKPLFCKKHPTEALKYFCVSCQLPVCTECVVTEHKLPEHESHKLGELEETAVATIKALMSEATGKKKVCEEASENLENSLSELQMQRDNAKDLVMETFHSYKAMLENVKDETLVELEDIHSSQEDHIMHMFHQVGKTLEKLEDSCKFTDRILTSGNGTEIMLTKRLITNQLLSLINNNTPTDRSTKIEFVTQPKEFENCIKVRFGTFNTTLEKEKSDSSCSLHSSFEKEGIQLPPGPLNTTAAAAASQRLDMFPPVTDMQFMSGLDGLSPLSVNMSTAMASQVAPTSAVSPHTINSIASCLQGLSGGAGSSLGGGCAPVSAVERSLSRNSYSPAMSDSGISVGAASTSSGNHQPVVNMAALAKLGAVNVNSQGQITLNGHLIPGLTMNSVSGLSQVLASRSSTPSTPLTPDIGLSGLLGGLGTANNPVATPLTGTTALSKPATPQIGEIAHFLSQPALLSPGASVESSGSQGQSVQPGFSLPSQSHGPARSSSKVNSMQIACKFGQLGPGKTQFNSPHGFCLGVDEDIVVADTNNHRIQIYDKTGEFKYQFGIPGREEGQLWYPRKVAVMLHCGKYIVCDRGNERSRMQIFTKNGHFMNKIAIRYIDIVAGLAINYAGQIVAVDSVSPTVFVISETGDLVKWFDCSDYMREPSDISVKDREYFVCDFKGHCVVVFSDEGQFLRRIGCENITNFPNGIDISNEGDILIGDSHGNRFHVAIFQKEGSLIGEFECPYVKVSRCCGLKITSEGYIVTLAKNNHHVLVLNPLYLY